ncbi:OLC1v1004999C1 [Oldenlandia corymbosa var. corymbosa]|uniref:OLC1v1004999C1 n=1 Tax=Oldenlandia corymbosa var. corymbosa TaxID=529605 RepID=A0AAV1DGK5_OLDCO|nr:OLC1v1004999C1 [Oldenlandia corymbosa var. corymbosa]
MKCICLLLLVVFVELAVGQSDLETLLLLKKGIQGGPSVNVLDSWDSKSFSSDGCPKNWYGISCSGGHVTSITLDNVGLTGVFDFTAIAGLKKLLNLSISNNQFSGSISGELGLISGLKYLDLSNNQFNGTMPPELIKLRTLVFLNFSLNHMEGTIPSGLTTLEDLKYLDLHSNGFTGDVMDLLADLGSVLHVDISSNKFSGSLDLGLGTANFISSIQYLNVSNNNLAGELFPHDGIPYFDNLQVFDATNNQFVGNLPSFNFVVSLQVLRIGGNQLSGALPEALLQESSMVLSELDLSLNQLEGPLGSISSLTLKIVNLSSNRFSGPLPSKVGHCVVIDLSNNMFSGNLSRIQSWGNYVEILDLSSNLLTGTFPNQTSQFLRLASLRLSNNSLEGVIPPVIGSYPRVKVIDFSLNHFSGFLSLYLFNSTELTDINLSFNNFSGTIPVDLMAPQNPNLLSLNLSHNELEGHLPPQLGVFQNLVYLDLSSNHFEGDIPNVLPDKLIGFNVSYNNLSGSVPKNLQRFPISAFHPGNTFLNLQYQSSAPISGPNMNLKRHGSQLNPATKIALIAGLVGGASIIVLLIFIIFCKFHCQDGSWLSSDGVNGKKGIHSPVPVSLPSSQMVHARDPANNTAIAPELKDLGQAEVMSKTDVIASDSSLMTSANTLPSNIQQLPESSAPLKVSSPDKLSGELQLFDSSLRFTAEELSYAPAEFIGTSCHGKLYKASLGSGHVLAVKWLKEGIVKGRKEFYREARKLGNIRHPNLVSLQGYYWGPRDHEKLLLTNYIDAPCLAFYLHDKDNERLPPLSLNERLKIAVDVARCLNYLHSDSVIPHGNLKSTNILVEVPKFHVLLTDYSLHRLMTSAGTAEQVLNASALGYRPPEFASTSKPCPSMKSDVYAFGVILLELLTGRDSAQVVAENADTIIDLTEWVRLLAIEDRSTEVFDTRILSVQERPLKALGSMLQVALRCILPADERPDMVMVFEDLSSIVSEHALQR